ncbi:MAG: metallophosphoesterase, partial [Oscillospiraceae bacterium]|nr:metallophosphoesterase [Oscillospiraceae bacterium]
MKKRLLSILLILMLLFSMIPGTAAFAQNADGKAAVALEEAALAASGATGTEAEDGPALRATKTKTVLTFTSDIHNQSNNTAANRLDTWLDHVIDQYGGVDAMGFCGDMGAASGSGDSWWGYVQSVMTIAENKLGAGKVFYTTGNHEFYNGSFASTSNAVKGKYIVGDTAVEANDYIIYCLGTDNWNNNQDNYTQGQVDKLTSFLATTGTTKPIIILTHYPIHTASSGSSGWGMGGRTTTNADLVIDALNAAAGGGRTIILLWGHNHTVSDPNYDQVFAPGTNVEYASGKTKTIQFYHMAAGCMSDSDYGSGSAYVKGKGLVIAIDSDKNLEFAYYDANGNNVTEDENGNPPDNPGGGGGDDPTPSANYYEIPDGDYYIESDDHYFLTTQAGDTYTNGSEGSEQYNYVGLKGVANRDDAQMWTFEKDEATGGYYIYVSSGAKADHQYLNATYVSNSSGGYDGTLKVDDTPDIWIIVSNGNGGLILKSTNASKTATEDKYLSHGNGDNSDSNTFTVRSNNSNNTATTIAYFDENGAEVTPTAGEGGDTPDDPPTGDTVSITPSTDNPSKSIKIGVGDTLTIKVTNGSSNSAYDFTATVSNSSVAEIQGNATVNISSGGTGTFTVKGLAEGTADITIQNNSSYGSQYIRKGVIHLTVGEGGSTPVDPPTGDTVNITPSTDNPEESITIKAGDTLAIKVTNGSTSSAYDFTATSGNTSTAAIQGNATANIAAGETATFTVKGLAAGTVDITVQNENSYGSQYVRKGVIHLTVTESQTEPPTPEGDFSLEISGPENAEVNSEVTYKLDLVSDNYEKFAAADITLTYDTARLTVKTLPACAEESNGTIRLLDYGDDKDIGKGIYSVTFTAKADGNATVTVTKAAFLPGELAATSDMIDATLTAASITTEIGHDWGDPVWAWTGNDTDGYTAATVTYKCKNDVDETHVYTAAATVTSVTEPATATTAGKTTWTATAKDPNGNNVTDTREVTIPASGYTYKDPVYSWTAVKDASGKVTGYEVTGLKECNESAAQNITETVSAVFSETSAATCETAGAGVWTATFTNTAFTVQTRNETISALGHAWGQATFDWAADGSSVTATRVCANDPTHVESETAQTTSEKTKDPTCDQKG